MESSSSSNPSSFDVPRIKYDVFFSFRGADIRSTFLSHLVKELHRHEIDAYVDDRLRRGDEISSALVQAIEEAFISLVIFSERYASSRWCMEELVRIIECMGRHQQIVIPVFYNVDPSDARHQKKTFEEAFKKHQDKYKENTVKLQSWRSALEKAANLSGFHYPSKYPNESKLIEEIIKDILEKLSDIFPDVSKGLVGIDKNFECVESLLAIESSEVRIVGIWGMGGIGKTAIAETIFAKYSSQYEGSCFLENVREESKKHGLSHLFQTLVSELLEGENPFLKGPAKARSTNVKKRLSRKKVFIVLDDVNKLDQLEHLIGEQVCLGPGSRVIVTTRDMHVLQNVHQIYAVQKLNFKHSLKLFCLKAFDKIYPKVGYEKLSKMAVGYADGNPLALRVLGSFLRPKSIEVWQSSLQKLRNYPHEDIYNVLKLSYDGLDAFEKDIFLDIAFFFKGKHKGGVIRFLDSCGFFAVDGIDNLQRKALISISNDNKIQMHDLIEQMGWEIVYEESMKDPGRRSRLRNPKDVCDVLKNNKGTDLVEGIMLDVSQIGDLHLHENPFQRMSKLRFLKLFDRCQDQRPPNIHIHTDLESFSDELRYMEWDRYPSKSLPSNFCAEKLVVLRMPQSQLSRLWDGVQDLVNLKEIDLYGCKQLVELPDFTKASNLGLINLSHCESLRRLHPSVFSIRTLQDLNLNYCMELRSLEDPIGLESLRCLYVDGCSSLEEISVPSEEIETVLLNRTRIDMLHSFISRLPPFSKLAHLSLKELRLKSLPNELCLLTSLRSLRLWDCEQLIELPANIKALSELESLGVWNCSSLQSLPELPQSIKVLSATNCTSLETFCTKAAFSLYDYLFFRFENCMRLDKHSIYAINLSALMTMAGATVRKFAAWRGFEVCYPGSKVPEWFRCRRSGNCMIVKFDQPSQLLGFILCFVISPPFPSDVGYHMIDACWMTQGWDEWETGLPPRVFKIEALKSDHVCMWSWCCPSDWTSDRQYALCRLTCRFSNLDIKKPAHSEEIKHDGVKECGFYPIYVSDIQNFTPKMELDSGTGYKSQREYLEEMFVSALESN